MSSSYEQNKLKTLATRKRTRNRRLDDGMTFEDDSSEVPAAEHTGFKLDSRLWRLWCLAFLGQSGKRKPKKKRRKLATHQGQGEDDKIEIFQRGSAPSDEKEELSDVDDNGENGALLTLPKTPLQLSQSLDDAVEKGAALHAEIRRKDGRQTTKVLLFVDSRSIFKLMKKKVHIRPEMVKPKSRLGVGSAKKLEAVYTNTRLVKTPLDRFKDVNSCSHGLRERKVVVYPRGGSVFYPYTGFEVQHAIFVAKEATSVINLDRKLLQNLERHSFIRQMRMKSRVCKIRCIEF